MSKKPPAANRNHPAQPKAAPQNHQAAQQITQIHQFSGPLPAPIILEQYDRIVPGAAERILRMAEQDAEHQRIMERGALDAAANMDKRGQRYGLAIGLAALAASVVALFLGYVWPACVIGGTTVVGLVTVFVVGRIRQQ